MMVLHLRNVYLKSHLFLGGRGGGVLETSPILRALILVNCGVLAMITFIPFQQFLIFPLLAAKYVL